MGKTAFLVLFYLYSASNYLLIFQALTYAEAKSKKKAPDEVNKKEKKAKQKEIVKSDEDKPPEPEGFAKQKIPNYMTVQVGFGLRRSHFPQTEVDPKH